MSVPFSKRTMHGFVLFLAVVLWGVLVFPPQAKAQQSQADCAPGWIYANGQCEQPRGGNGGGNMDAACQATARFDYCRASVYIGCTSWGNQYACRLLQLANTNPNGFQQIMNAQKACSLEGNQQACAWLQQFRGTYY